jgi:hypothetical protein
LVPNQIVAALGLETLWLNAIFPPRFFEVNPTEYFWPVPWLVSDFAEKNAT